MITFLRLRRGFIRFHIHAWNTILSLRPLSFNYILWLDFSLEFVLLERLYNLRLFDLLFIFNESKLYIQISIYIFLLVLYFYIIFYQYLLLFFSTFLNSFSTHYPMNNCLFWFLLRSIALFSFFKSSYFVNST